MNDDRTRPGDWSNAVFFTRAVLFRTECVKRLQVIEEQAKAIEQFREQLKPAPFSARLQRLFRPK